MRHVKNMEGDRNVFQYLPSRIVYRDQQFHLVKAQHNMLMLAKEGSIVCSLPQATTLANGNAPVLLPCDGLCERRDRARFPEP